MARREMTEGDLCSLIDLVESVGIEIWLDGGWAVDAWLGHQTRRPIGVTYGLLTSDRHQSILDR